MPPPPCLDSEPYLCLLQVTVKTLEASEVILELTTTTVPVLSGYRSFKQALNKPPGEIPKA